jgi:hypothetical protein
MPPDHPGMGVAKRADMRPCRSVSCVGLAVLVAAGSASAEPAPVDLTVPPEEPAETVKAPGWYGAPILVTDLVAAGMGVAALAFTQDHSESATTVFALGAVSTYLLGGPIVHGVQGEGNRVVGSAALRVLAPIGGGLAGLLIAAPFAQACGSNDGHYCSLERVMVGTAVGFGVGVVTASAIDIGLLAVRRRAESSEPRVALVPTIDPSGGLGGVSLQGTW